MHKLVFRMTAILALFVQVFNPLWWWSVAISFAFYWIEGLFEDVFSGIERMMDPNDHLVFDPCFLDTLCHFESLLLVLFFVYSIIALIVASKVSFSRHHDVPALSTKRDILFFVINLVTILLAIMQVYWSGGSMPHM